MSARSDPISFYDDYGLRWTVVADPLPRPGPRGNQVLVFTSESGERRTCEGCLPEGSAWDDVDERAWRTLLRYADAAPGP